MLRRIHLNDESASADAARPVGACASRVRSNAGAKAKVANSGELRAVLRIKDPYTRNIVCPPFAGLMVTATSQREYAPLSGLYLSHVLIGKSAARALGQAR